MGYRILGEPFRKYGARSLGQSGHPGFQWAQEATFEAGLLTPYPTGFDSVAGAGVASLAVNAAAAMRGFFGFFVGIPDVNARFGELTDPNGETRINLEFLFDPNTLTMANGDAFQILVAVSPGAGLQAFRLGIIMTGVDYQFQSVAKTDAGGAAASPAITITDEAHFIRLEWLASSEPGADNGSLELFIDGVSVDLRSGIDNDTHNVTSLQFGAVLGIDAGTGGVGEGIYFDNIRWANKFR